MRATFSARARNHAGKMAAVCQQQLRSYDSYVLSAVMPSESELVRHENPCSRPH